ncbi:Gaba permease [Mycena sanguinolenta]|uniref:Gaba permease n=1 Tax=Mycena sanguinolenta TaxID=230812 RepID=A0A8H6ZCW7_9AGAR|nr:Gaba permease [Mycena sanguinolenta]
MSPQSGSTAAQNREAVRLADEQLLATLGYKQEFKRAFSPLEVFGIAFSIIGLLPSIASVLFYSLPNGGGPAMVWGWAVASLFILCVGMSMAELASAAPTSGGLYFWTYSLSSPRWRNLLCWIVGYANTIGSISAVASIDWAAAIQTYGVYVAILFSHTLICCLGTAVLARLQTVYVILNVILCLVVIIALPAATPAAFKNTAEFALGKFQNFNGWPNGYAFILSFLAPLWTICSFDSSVHISEEASNAATAVPWAIVCAIGIAGVLGFAINISLAFCMGKSIFVLLTVQFVNQNQGTDLETLYGSAQPMAAIFFNSFGVRNHNLAVFPSIQVVVCAQKRPTLALWAIVVIVQYMMGSSMLLAASRQTYAFSRDGALPFSSWLYRMSKFTGTPVNTVMFDAFLSAITGLLVFAGSQAINAVFAISVTALYVAYAIPIVARFAGQNDFKPGPFSLGVFSLPVAIIAVLFMLFLGIAFLFPTTPQTDVGDMNYTIVVMGGVMVLSLIGYFMPIVGGKYWFKGPVANIVLAEADNDSQQESDTEKGKK